jgi:hypothetical protein
MLRTVSLWQPWSLCPSVMWAPTATQKRHQKGRRLGRWCRSIDQSPVMPQALLMVTLARLATSPRFWGFALQANMVIDHGVGFYTGIQTISSPRARSVMIHLGRGICRWGWMPHLDSEVPRCRPGSRAARAGRMHHICPQVCGFGGGFRWWRIFTKLIGYS